MDINLLCPHVLQERFSLLLTCRYAHTWRADIINYVPTVGGLRIFINIIHSLIKGQGRADKLPVRPWLLFIHATYKLNILHGIH